MKEKQYYLIDSEILPPVFQNVVHAKELLASGKASSAAGAAKLAGISRSAFYKYKDFVFKYSSGGGNTISLNALLSDRAGVFSSLTAALYDLGANIVTVSQGLPENGTANVSLTVESKETQNTLVDKLLAIDGVISVKIIGLTGGKPAAVDQGGKT